MSGAGSPKETRSRRAIDEASAGFANVATTGFMDIASGPHEDHPEAGPGPDLAAILQCPPRKTAALQRCIQASAATRRSHTRLAMAASREARSRDRRIADGWMVTRTSGASGE